MAIGDNTGVAAVHPDYKAFSGKWKRTRDVIAGEDAVHTAGVAYLPKLKDEGAREYQARRDRTTFYNATWRTVSALLGMLFRKEPNIQVPTAIEDFLDDITQSGVPFNVFAEEVAFEVLAPGRVGILVDHPPAPDTNGAPLTVAVAERLGLRPTLALYKAEGIINWRHQSVNNKWTLCQVRLRECVKQAVDEFTDKDVDQIRVLDLNPDAGMTYRQRLFRKDPVTGQWVQFENDIVPLMNGLPLDFIPFVFVTANGTVADVDEPPLIDLVDLNLKHYQVSADYEHACHFTGLPTPWIAGISPAVDPETGRELPQSFYIGSTAAWVFRDANTKVGFLEFTGQGVTALKDNLTGKEAQMAAIGARMLAPEKSGVEASQTLAMRHSGEQSVLAKIGISCSEGLEQALTWLAQWAGADGEVECDLNRDFMPVNMDGPTLTAIMGAWQQGALSEPELFDLFKRADLIASDKTLADHQGEVQAAPPMGLQMQGALLDNAQNPPATAPVDKGGK